MSQKLNNEVDGKLFTDEEAYFAFGKLYSLRMKCGNDSGWNKQTNLQFIQGNALLYINLDIFCLLVTVGDLYSNLKSNGFRN